MLSANVILAYQFLHMYFDNNFKHFVAVFIHNNAWIIESNRIIYHHSSLELSLIIIKLMDLSKSLKICLDLQSLTLSQIWYFYTFKYSSKCDFTIYAKVFMKYLFTALKCFILVSHLLLLLVHPLCIVGKLVDRIG